MIIIKPADKGSAVLILSRDQYTRVAICQLNECIHLMNNEFITRKQKLYLEGEETIRERRFYMLPKIHKPPEKWNPPFEIPPGSAIVSDCSSETY